VEPAPLFSFETQPGAVNVALKTVLDSWRHPGLTDVEASRALSEMAQAETVIKRESQTAAAIIIRNLQRLPSNDVTLHSSLYSLLYLVATEDIAMQYLQKAAMSGPPEPSHRSKPLPMRSQVNQRGNSDDQEDPHSLIRYMAMNGLFVAARDGKPRARLAILEAVRSVHRDTKVTAIRYYYALSKSRVRAKAEMRLLLSAPDQYLLNLY
jgi:hypothetical protein